MKQLLMSLMTFLPLMCMAMNVNDFRQPFLLSYTDRELATVSMLTALGGVEPMAGGHIAICRHLGITTAQLNSLLDIIEYNMGPAGTAPIRKIVTDTSHSDKS